MEIFVDSEEQKQRLLEESIYIHNFMEPVHYKNKNGRSKIKWIGLDSDKAGLLMHIYLNPDIIKIKKKEMGNLGFIIPTKKLEDFNIDKIYSMLKEEFSDFNIEKGDSAIGIYKDTDLVCNLYFNQDCYLLNYDRDINTLEEITKESEESKYYQQTKERNNNLIKSLKELKDLNPDLNNVIQTTYGYGKGFDYKNDVDFFIKDYFYGYIFDEGIHPEFIPPEYVRKSKSKRFDGKTFVQKFASFLNRNKK